jgi:hypothetical protein
MISIAASDQAVPTFFISEIISCSNGADVPWTTGDKCETQEKCGEDRLTYANSTELKSQKLLSVPWKP